MSTPLLIKAPRATINWGLSMIWKPRLADFRILEGPNTTPPFDRLKTTGHLQAAGNSIANPKSTSFRGAKRPVMIFGIDLRR